MGDLEQAPLRRSPGAACTLDGGAPPLDGGPVSGSAHTRPGLSFPALRGPGEFARLRAGGGALSGQRARALPASRSLMPQASVAAGAPQFSGSRSYGQWEGACLVATVLGLVALPMRLAPLDYALAVLVFVFFFASINPRVMVQMMFLAGYSTFLFFPALANAAVYETGFELFYLSSLVSVAFVRMTRDLRNVPSGHPLPRAPFVFFVATLLTVVAVRLHADWAASTFALYLVVFFMAMDSRSRALNGFMLVLFCFTLSIYALYGWTGFGRTVVGGWLLCGVLGFCYSSNIRVSKIVFALLPPLASTLTVSRSISSLGYFGLDSVLQDSAFGPYRLVSSFASDAMRRGLDIPGYIDQVLFTLGVFIPRAWWPTKPFGFGFEYTVRNLDQSHIEAGHSIAGTLIGDNVYFLGYFGLATILVVTWAVAQLCRIAYRVPVFYGHGQAAVACSIPVFVWGGMTSFSARIAMPLIILGIASPFIRMIVGRPDYRSLPQLPDASPNHPAVRPRTRHKRAIGARADYPPR